MPMTVIAIDGPAAAGKGTLARTLAAQYGLAYLDTGLLYRAVARRARDTGADPIAVARDLKEDDLSAQGLRDAVISQEASRVSAIPEVRTALTEFQVAFAGRPGGAVLDGRDIGTVICPEADLKLFVTASVEARAARRHAELVAAGFTDDFSSVLEEIQIRDARDSGRATAPLKPAADAVTIDTSDLDIAEVRARAFALVDALRQTQAYPA